MRMEEQGEEKYRHEFKYLCTQAQAVMLQVRLQGLMLRDAYAGADGKYRIKSLYFDDMYDRCFYENEDGTAPREKYRIRIYNDSCARIALECKHKEGDRIRKESCLLEQEQCEALAFGKGSVSVDGLPSLAKRLLVLQKSCGMKPKVIVSYERMPYVYPNGNVRVTFDAGIACGGRVEEFLKPEGARRPILPSGMMLLEVKYDEYLPDPIYHALSMADMQRVTFSKYYLCRRYHMYAHMMPVIV